MPWKCSKSECGDKVLWNDSKSKFYLWNSCLFLKNLGRSRGVARRRPGDPVLPAIMHRVSHGFFRVWVDFDSKFDGLIVRFYVGV